MISQHIRNTIKYKYFILPLQGREVREITMLYYLMLIVVSRIQYELKDNAKHLSGILCTT